MAAKYVEKTCQLCNKKYTWKYDEPDLVTGIVIPGMDVTPSHLSYTNVCHKCLGYLGRLISSYRESLHKIQIP